ncbi:MAG: Ig-like domain-containing protein, partial [Bacteroidales bacterium]|nr:Ig-like domain-containing protein [Bacteroidales bacterium]
MNKFYLSIVFVLLLCAGKVHAQIVFTDINPDVSSTMKEDPGWTSNIVPIDFNNDGTEDYNFRWDDWGTDWFMHMTFAGNNEFILKGTATNPFGGRYIQALDKDAVIDNSGNWGMSFPEPFIGDANDPNFRGLGDKYVGVRFIVGGKKYYGWVLVSFEGKTLTVKEYAYNSVADSPINAGDKGVAGTAVTSVTINGAAGASSITTDDGTLQMSADILPADATNKRVTWSVTETTGKASINHTGLLKALDNGKVTVVAAANDGSGIIAQKEITISGQVIPVINVTRITLTTPGFVKTITTDNGTLQVWPSVTPFNASDKTVTWSINDGTGSAVVDNTGIVTAVSDGTVTVVATANDGSGIKGELEITISGQVPNVNVTGITVTGAADATTITAKDGTLQMSAAVLPADATDKTVTWSVTNGTGSATIDNAGLLTAVTDGTVKVVATANDGSGIKGELEITISGQVAPVLV